MYLKFFSRKTKVLYHFYTLFTNVLQSIINNFIGINSKLKSTYIVSESKIKCTDKNSRFPSNFFGTFILILYNYLSNFVPHFSQKSCFWLLMCPQLGHSLFTFAPHLGQYKTEELTVAPQSGQTSEIVSSITFVV